MTMMILGKNRLLRTVPAVAFQGTMKFLRLSDLIWCFSVFLGSHLSIASETKAVSSQEDEILQPFGSGALRAAPRQPRAGRGAERAPNGGDAERQLELRGAAEVRGALPG